MRRAFSRRERGERSTAPREKVAIMHRQDLSIGDDKEWSPPASASALSRSMSRREKFVRVITNPDTIFRYDPSSPPPESKFNPNPNGKLIRTFFSNSLDVAPCGPAPPPTPPTPSLEADTPLFDAKLVSKHLWCDLPNGYDIRPLRRSDYARGYMQVVRMLGKTGGTTQEAWDARCEWLRRNTDSYFIVVVVDGEDAVVATGTLLFERKFTLGMGVVAHVQDIAVAKSQKGKKIGLKVLQALVYAAAEYGALKTLVNCSETNESFHAQCGFAKEGSLMVLHNSKKIPESPV